MFLGSLLFPLQIINRLKKILKQAPRFSHNIGQLSYTHMQILAHLELTESAPEVLVANRFISDYNKHTVH